MSFGASWMEDLEDLSSLSFDQNTHFLVDFIAFNICTHGDNHESLSYPELKNRLDYLNKSQSRGGPMQKYSYSFLFLRICKNEYS